MNVFRRMLGLTLGVLLLLSCAGALALQENYFSLRRDVGTSAYLPELQDTGTAAPSSLGDQDPFGAHYCISLLLLDEIELVLNGRYEEFHGTVFIPGDDLARQLPSVVRIYADDRLIYESPVMDGKTKSQPFLLDVTGVDFLKITKTDVDFKLNHSSRTKIGDPIVCLSRTPPSREPLPGVPGSEFQMPGNGVALSALQPFAKQKLHSRNGYTDLRGNTYTHALLMEGIVNSSMRKDPERFGMGKYLVDGEYSLLGGIIVVDPGAGAETVMSLCVYADDVLVYRSENLTLKSKPISFLADISGADCVTVMGISTKQNVEIALCDGYLVP